MFGRGAFYAAFYAPSEVSSLDYDADHLSEVEGGASGDLERMLADVDVGWAAEES